MTLINKDRLSGQLFDQKIKKMFTPLKVRGRGILKHTSTQFAEVSFFFLGESNKGQKVYASINCKLHLVEAFRANILISNDIFVPKRFVFNVGIGYALVGSCGVKISIKARKRGWFIRKRLLPEKDKVIPPRSETMILFLSVPLPDNRDFLFHPTTQPNLALFTHMIHHNTKKTFVRNISNHPLRISRHQKLGHVVDI